MKVAEDIKDDPVLKQLVENMHNTELFLLNNRTDLTQEAIERIQSKVKMLRFNYNTYVEKKYINKNRIHSLSVPGPQSEEEKSKLYELIYSV